MSAKLRSDPHFAIILSIHLLANVFFIPIISRLFLLAPLLKSIVEIEAKVKQDQVNNAKSAFIFVINLSIIQGCQSGSVGQDGQLVQVVQVVQVVRVAWVVRVVPVIKFVNAYGFHGLNNQIIEKT